MSQGNLFLIVVAVLVAPFLVLPWRFVMRLAWAEAVAALLIWRLIPRTAPSEVTVGQAIGQVLIAGILAALTVAFLLRLAFEAYRRAGAGRKLYEPMPRIDRLLALVTGAVVILVEFVAVGWIFAGMKNALALHGLLFAAGFVLLWVAWRRGAGVGRWSAAGMGGTLLLLTLVSLAYPWIVLRSATEVSEGAPHCIVLNSRRDFAAGPLDLTFLTLDKSQHAPHVTLVIDGQSLPAAPGAHYGPYTWSYRKMRFQDGTYALPGPACPKVAPEDGMIWAE